MARFIPIPGNTWRTIIKEKWTRHALDSLYAELGASLEDIHTVVNSIETDVETIDLTHNLLDTPIHVDTESNPPLPGSLVVGSPAESVDFSLYWVDGLPIDILNTPEETGGVDFWFDGLPWNSVESLTAGDVVWVRLEVGADTYVLTSRGTFVEWAPISSVVTPVYASAAIAAAQTIAKDTATLIVLTTPAFDTGPFWDVTEPTKFTVPTGQGGTFRINGQISWGTGTLGALRARLLKNGTIIARDEISSNVAEATPGQHVEALAALADGDYVQLEAFWTYSDAVGRTVTAGTAETFLQLEKVA